MQYKIRVTNLIIALDFMGFSQVRLFRAFFVAQRERRKIRGWWRWSWRVQTRRDSTRVPTRFIYSKDDDDLARPSRPLSLSFLCNFFFFIFLSKLVCGIVCWIFFLNLWARLHLLQVFNLHISAQYNIFMIYCVWKFFRTGIHLKYWETFGNWNLLYWSIFIILIYAPVDDFFFY